MFEYTKEILQKVSFDKELFGKELKKAVKWLKYDERKLLMLWCIATFGNQYIDIIHQVFKVK
nr:hypothetical protein [Bacteroidota bacterium]